MANSNEMLRLAEKRNMLIPRLLESGGFYMSPDPKKVARLRRFLEPCIGPSSIEGEYNIEKALKLQQEGSQLLITANHLTDADTHGKRVCLERAGYKELANRSLYPAGLKMIERRYVKFFMGAEHTLLIATPFDSEKVELLMNGDLSVIERRAFEMLKRNYRRLNMASARKGIELVNQGYAMSLYPEATRSRDGYLGKAPAEVAAYAKPDRKSGTPLTILPMVLLGLEETFPSSGLPIRPWIKNNPILRVGRPYDASRIWNEKAQRLVSITSEDDLAITPADILMLPITRLVPERIKSCHRPIYKRIARELCI